MTYNRTTCATTDTRSVSVYTAESGLCGSCSSTQTFAWNADDYDGGERRGLTVYGATSGGCTGIGALFGCVGETVTTTQINLSTGCGGCASGNVTITLSSEYTTALLSSDVDTLLAAASWSGWGSCPDAIFTQSTNELTISKRQVWYEWTFGACGSPGTLEFDIYDRTSSTLQAHITISLTAGQTVADYILNPPATAGMALYITNVVISC